MDYCFSKNNIVNISQGSYCAYYGITMPLPPYFILFFIGKRVYMFINNLTFHSIYQLQITYIHYLSFKPTYKLENTKLDF